LYKTYIKITQRIRAKTHIVLVYDCFFRNLDIFFNFANYRFCTTVLTVNGRIIKIIWMFVLHYNNITIHNIVRYSDIRHLKFSRVRWLWRTLEVNIVCDFIMLLWYYIVVVHVFTKHTLFLNHYHALCTYNIILF